MTTEQKIIRATVGLLELATMYAVEAGIAVEVLPFCAKLNPIAATPTVVKGTTTMKTKRIWLLYCLERVSGYPR
jgi:hypothetical protein